MTDELTTHDWCARTGGALTGAQRRRLLASVVADYPRLAADVGRLALGRGSAAASERMLPAVDDEVMAAVVAATAHQGPSLQRHGLRTFWFGALLAGLAGVDVDIDELLVASAAHDVGLTSAVEGEDFTLRSAESAVATWTDLYGQPDSQRATRLRDAVVAHATPGVAAATAPLGWAVQAGAVADLVGLRLPELAEGVVDHVYRQHPQDGMRRMITRAIDAEATAVPAGRFALLRRTGFGLAIRVAPHRSR